MPVKNHRPSLTRTHSRSSSGGGSRLALNLQITQKDPVQPKVEKGAKRTTGHVYETGTRSASKTSSATRVRSAEHIANPPKRAPLPHAHRAQGGRPKAGFTLASPGSDEDEEWVSSESGAATPNHHTDDGPEDSVTTPQERHRPANNFLEDVAEQPSTPRAEQPQLRGGISNDNGSSKHNRTVSASRVAPLPSIPDPEPAPTQSADPERQSNTQPFGTSQHVSHLAETMPSVASAASAEKNTTSTTTSPISGKPSRQHPHPHPHPHPPPVKQPSLSRAHSISHSTHSSTSSKAEHAHPLRPHPLIRGQAIGHANLAPLSVTSDAAQAQLSASPSPPNTRRDARLSSSPTSTKTASAHPSPLHSSPASVSSRSNYRRPSTSSVRSAATVPVQPMSQIVPLGAQPVARHRTLSALSPSSSSAALSSLAHLPTATRPAPLNSHLTVHFPPPNPHVHPESVHPLLPPPYIAPHLSLLAWRSPIQGSYENVMRAKQRKRGG